MNEVYVIAGGEWLRNNLNAIAAFMGTRTWDSIEKIALTLSVLAVAVMWVQRHNVMDLLGWVAVFVLISLLVNVRTSVQIIDNSDLVKVHRVDNVPVGLAMPLSLTTRIGHAMVAGYEMVFAQPDSATYSKTGMLFGANLIVKSTDFLSRKHRTEQKVPCMGSAAVLPVPGTRSVSLVLTGGAVILSQVVLTAP